MRPFLTLVTFITLSWSPAWAQTSQNQPSAEAVGVNTATVVNKALSAEEQAKMREQLRTLAAAMGLDEGQPAAPTANGNQPAAGATAQAQAQQPQKTMADVADKALNMVGGLVASVSETLQKVAPEIWKIMIRQQYAKAIGDLILPIVLLLMCVAYWAIIKRGWVKDPHACEDARIWRVVMVTGVPIFFGIIFTIWTAVSLSDSIKYLINPEYYAVRDLLLMLLRPGAVQ